MKIRITDLALRTIIGVYDWEREKKQDIIVNIELEFDGTKAAESDQLDDTVDYKTIKQNIIQMVEASSFGLLEKLASEVLKIVLADAKVQSATVRIDKPGALRFTKSVSVEVSGKR